MHTYIHTYTHTYIHTYILVHTYIHGCRVMVESDTPLYCLSLQNPLDLAGECLPPCTFTYTGLFVIKKYTPLDAPPTASSASLLESTEPNPGDDSIHSASHRFLQALGSKQVVTYFLLGISVPAWSWYF
jgi:hypothetical protein